MNKPFKVRDRVIVVKTNMAYQRKYIGMPGIVCDLTPAPFIKFDNGDVECFTTDEIELI